ncbi:MAG TPA: hypothetical protein ENH82_07015, partial [bacterium]|nr:hypothetical protein [bacterium]
PDTLPGTLPEMRNPAYWIGKMENPDEVIITADKIMQMNEEYVKKMSVPEPFKGIPPERIPLDKYLNRFPGHFIVKPDIRSMKPDEIPVIVKGKIREDIDFLRKEKYGNFFSVEYADREIDAFEKEMAPDLVEDAVVSRDGIAVCTTRLRIVPSFFPEQVGLNNIGKNNYSIDLWTSSLVKIGKHVTVLHRSLSGSHVFVLSDNGFGWVESQSIAFGHIVEIKEFNNPEDFIICTGDRVPFYSDKRCMYVSGWLRMGDRVPVASKENPRIIIVPARYVNGKFRSETAWLAENADISVGWLPYTRRNIVETAFKLLDNPYDWTESSIGRNHETTYRDIFACFGFELPYHGSLFTFFGDYEEAAMPDIGREKQYKRVFKHKSFVTIMTSHSHGHSMLLLGEYNGKPIAFDHNGYGYTDENGTEYQVKRTCLVDMSIPAYFLKNPITFLELK